MKNTLQRYGHLINLQIIQEKKVCFITFIIRLNFFFGLV
jgi:hypothetical protein